MSGLKGAECRKFQANIFNKSKCTNCFKQREEHSPEALESNRASRKVSKCGYLFVAPDWDFTIPLNRTKRWQRRWFVLYDDGELTYCLDDHPATIPQGVVDMNRVLEVSCAEEVTGNQFSLAITAPDRVTFIKATCKEEAKWWMDVLSVFPGTLKQGRHKRNATFPGIKTTTAKQTRHTAATMAPTAFETAAGQRVRFHSCTTDPMIESRPQSAPAPTLEAEEDVFPTKDSSPPASSTLQSSTHSSTNTSRCFSTPISTSTPLSSLPPSSTPFSSLPPSSARLLREEHKENTPYIGDYTDNPPTSESPPTQDKMSHKLRARRAMRRTEGRGVGLTQPRSKSEVSGMFHPTHSCPLARHQPSTTSAVIAAAAAVTTSNTPSGALTGCSAPLATTNSRGDGDTNSNHYQREGLSSSVSMSARGVPLPHSYPAGESLHPPSHSLRRQSLPSPHGSNTCFPSSLVSPSLHSARESSKPIIYSSCGSIASSSSSTMAYSPNSSSFSSSTIRQVASPILPSSPTKANPLKPFFKQSRGRRRATIDVASSLSSLTSLPSFATQSPANASSSSSSSTSTPTALFPPLGLNSYSTSYLAGYKRGSLGGTATPPLLSHSLSSSTLGLAMHAPLPSQPLPRASTPPARPGVWAN